MQRILKLENATNQPKSTVKLGYMCHRGLSGPAAVILTKCKHSGSILRNACVACETSLCVTTKKVSLPDRRTHGQTDRRRTK